MSEIDNSDFLKQMEEDKKTLQHMVSDFADKVDNRDLHRTMDDIEREFLKESERDADLLLKFVLFIVLVATLGTIGILCSFLLRVAAR